MSTVKFLRYMVKDEKTAYEGVLGVDVVKEMFDAFGRQVEMKKIALKSSYAVPWVMNNQSCRCMRCDSKFGLTKWKHHCRGCGYLVCHGCSAHKAKLNGIKESAGSRMCKTCRVGNATQASDVKESPVAKKASTEDAPSIHSMASASTEVDAFHHTDLDSVLTCE